MRYRHTEKTPKRGAVNEHTIGPLLSIARLNIADNSVERCIKD